jgi:protocatechuate 3,4-dioxygenase beta subunit
MYQGMPNKINNIDTSAGWYNGSARLLITGKVLGADGITPAAGIIIYYWQTDERGYYSPNKDVAFMDTPHGYLRGWMKTDSNGEYHLYTSRPAPYPGRDIPAHIHLLIKEPEINEYYIDDLVFDDDTLLSNTYHAAAESRGGSGMLRLIKGPDFQVAEKNIVLGLHIPGHPNIAENCEGEESSGLAIGEDQPSFTPFHAWGADRGSIACPVCKYGRYHGVLYFVGDRENWEDIRKWLLYLEQESVVRTSRLKVYFISGKEGDSFLGRKKILEKLGEELKLKNVALTFVPSFKDEESEIYRSKINPLLKNTFIIYRHRNIVGKFLNLSASEANFVKIQNVLDETMSPYFNWEALH